MAIASEFEQIFHVAGVACYIASAVAAWFTGFRRFNSLLINLAWIMFLLTIIVRWVTLGQGPFMTLYEVLISNLFSLGLIFSIACYLNKSVQPAAAALSFILSILGIWSLATSTTPVPLPATFENNWLWIHVAAGKIFLGTCLVAVALSLTCLLQMYFMRLMPAHLRIPETAENTIWRYLSLAFIADSVMLLAGAVWAHDAWGRYWAWDPLETWSFITWLVLAIVLHLRLTFTLPRWVYWSMINGVFVLAFLTFFGVPFISLAPHKGVM